MRFDPGPGWGGHCIPVDPFYLTYKAREFGAAPKFIELAGEINVRMHEYVVGKLTTALNALGKSVNGAQILLLGIAYKKDIGDCRESPAFPIMHQLQQLGARLSYSDPYVPAVPSLREWPAFEGWRSSELDEALLGVVDVALIVTDHSIVDYEWLVTKCALVVDTRGVCRAPAPNLVKA